MSISNPGYNVTIKEMPLELRPRERLIALGAETLPTSELLAIIIGSGNKEDSAIALAYRLLSLPGGLSQLATASVEEIQEIRGIGPAKACQVKAALELAKRLAALGGESRPVIRSPQDIAALVLEEMRSLDREHFKTLALNTKNQVLAIETVSIGSLNSSIVHPREVFKNPIKRSAAAIVLVHNHPSGDPTPSSEDVAVTKRLIEAGKILGVEVLDHLVTGNKGYISLREKNLM
ncbi:MAG: DNA repair protein RadC [Clostridia bacterium]|nr:DNA repair protein RadC [Clostridia bacterium]